MNNLEKRVDNIEDEISGDEEQLEIKIRRRTWDGKLVDENGQEVEESDSDDPEVIDIRLKRIGHPELETQPGGGEYRTANLQNGDKDEKEKQLTDEKAE